LFHISLLLNQESETIIAIIKPACNREFPAGSATIALEGS